jgi:hypothetical protein
MSGLARGRGGGADSSPRRHDTGAGGDNRLGHQTNCLRFPYGSTFLRSQSLHAHPYHPWRTEGERVRCWVGRAGHLGREVQRRPPVRRRPAHDGVEAPAPAGQPRPVRQPEQQPRALDLGAHRGVVEEIVSCDVGCEVG